MLCFVDVKQLLIKTIKKMKKDLIISKLTIMGVYTYVGFAITQKATSKLAEEKTEEGESITIEKKAVNSIIFADKQGSLFYLNNNEIVDFTEEKPYGMFQKFMNGFNSTYRVELNQNFEYTINPDL